MKKPVVVVTGASQGIGSAIARLFASEIRGVRLVLVARNAAKLEDVAKACRQLKADARAFPCDVSDEEMVEGMAKRVEKEFGRVDVLINNAGKFVGAPFLSMSVADFDRILAADLRSVFLVSRAFAGGMVRRKQGHIFNMGSVAGLVVHPGGAAYSAAKFGVTGLTRVMRAELRDKGVRVTCVFPGATYSPSWDGSGVPKKRMMPAEDVARAFLDAWRLSRRTVVEEIVLRPQLGDL